MGARWGGRADGPRAWGSCRRPPTGHHAPPPHTWSAGAFRGPILLSGAKAGALLTRKVSEGGVQRGGRGSASARLAPLPPPLTHKHPRRPPVEGTPLITHTHTHTHSLPPRPPHPDPPTPHSHHKGQWRATPSLRALLRWRLSSRWCCPVSGGAGRWGGGAQAAGWGGGGGAVLGRGEAVLRRGAHTLPPPLPPHPTHAPTHTHTSIAVSFFEQANCAHFNSLVVADTDGSIAGHYRKSHIPDGPG